MMTTQSAFRQCLILVITFFLTIQITLATGTECKEGMIGIKSVSIQNDDFDIMVKPTSTVGEYEVYVVERSGGNLLYGNPNEGVYFFIIMPDGNFLTLDNKVNYKTIYKFQSEAGSFTIPVASIQAWGFKKNDPVPPPASKTFTPKVDDGSLTGGSSFVLNSTTDLTRASVYLNSVDNIKIGTSWNPWTTSLGPTYYFLIVSFTNKGSNPSGVVILDSCAAPIPPRFSLDGYIAYNMDGNKLWAMQNSLPANNQFLFSNLKVGEVRHIYIKLKDNGNGNTVVPEFRAKISDTVNQIQVTDCLGGRINTAPYDPNQKIVDQTNCTINGVGKLGYTIVYQNEGDGFTGKVIIEDKFPSMIDPTPVMNFKKEPRIQSHQIVYPTFKPNTVCFYLGDNAQPYHLPGLAQSIPRRYTFDETVGWISFDVAAECPGPGSPIKNFAVINFVDTANNLLPDITTNSAVTQPDEVPRPNWPVGKKKLKWWQRLFKIKKR